MSEFPDKTTRRFITWVLILMGTVSYGLGVAMGYVLWGMG